MVAGHPLQPASARMRHATLCILLCMYAITLGQAALPTNYYPNATSFTITSAGKSVGDPFFNVGDPYEFQVAGVAAPQLILARNVTYEFQAGAVFDSMHIFYMTTSSVGHSDGIQISGSPSFTTGGSGSYTADQAGGADDIFVFYYQCENHDNMGNRIIVIPSNYSGDFNFSQTPDGRSQVPGATLTTANTTANITANNATANTNTTTIPNEVTISYYPDATTFVITSSSKHPGDPQYGIGSGFEFHLNGTAAPIIILTRNVSYFFMAGSPFNTAHIFYFSNSSVGKAAGPLAGNPSVTTNGSGLYTADPTGGGGDIYVLYYQCMHHTNMGNRIIVVPPNFVVSDYNITALPDGRTSPYPPPPNLYSAYTEFIITVETKQEGDPFFGVGQNVGFHLNGTAAPELILVRNQSYLFVATASLTTQHSFYFTSSSIGLGEGAIAGAPVLPANTQGTFIADPTGNPHSILVLWYECVNHQYMGAKIIIIPQFYDGDYNFTALPGGRTPPDGPTYYPPPSNLYPNFTTFLMTVGFKLPTDPFYHVGQNQAWRINGSAAPQLILVRNQSYQFVVSANVQTIHGLYFTDSDEGYSLLPIANTPYIDPNSSAIYVADPDGGPNDFYVLHYECINHGQMGNKIIVIPSNFSGPYDFSSLPLGRSNISALQAQNQSNATCSTTKTFSLQLISPDYTLTWTVDPVQQLVHLEFQGALSPGVGFVGLGFGAQSMINADLIACFIQEDGTPYCVDAYTYNHAPIFDIALPGGEDNVVNVGYELDDAGISHFYCTRPLNASDPYDVMIPDAALDIIYSHGHSAGLVYHGLPNRGWGTLNFYTGQSVLVQTDNQSILLTHGISMLIVWLFFYPMGGLIARHCKHWNFWVNVHEFCQKAGAFSVISFAFMALISSNNHFLTLHSVLGVTIVCFLITQLSLGEFAKWRIRTNHAQRWHRTFARCHQLIGIFLITIGLYQVRLGLDLLWPNQDLPVQLYYAALAVICSAFFTSELYRQYSGWRHLVQTVKPDGTPQAFDKIIPDEISRRLKEYTWAEISERIRTGSKWLVISGIIFDVKNYINSHPGGKTILEESLGTDSTNAFLGVAEDEGMLVHHHSAFAWNKLRGMAVGRVKMDEEAIAAREKRQEGMEQLDVKSRLINNLSKLLQQRRLDLAHSEDAASQNFRYYKLILKRRMSRNVILFRFDQSAHERPFIWKTVFTPGSEVKVTVNPLLLPDEGSSAGVTSPTHQSRVDRQLQRRLTVNHRTSVIMGAFHTFRSLARGREDSAQVGPSPDSQAAAAAASPVHRLPSSELQGAVSAANEQQLTIASPSKGSKASPLSPTGNGDGSEGGNASAPAEPAPLINNPRSSFMRRLVSLADNGKARAQRLLQHTKSHCFLPGEHLEFATYLGNESVERYYTPFPSSDSKSFDIIVKIYDNGLMTQYLKSRSLGEFSKCRGPVGTPIMCKDSKDGVYQIMVMVCGGTGITPMFQIMNYYLALNANKNAATRSHLVLLAFYHSKEDMIMPEYVQDLVSSSDGCLHVFYALTEKKFDDSKAKWQGFRGYVNGDMIQEILFTVTNSYLQATQPVPDATLPAAAGSMAAVAAEAAGDEKMNCIAEESTLPNFIPAKKEGDAVVSPTPSQPRRLLHTHNSSMSQGSSGHPSTNGTMHSLFYLPDGTTHAAKAVDQQVDVVKPVSSPQHKTLTQRKSAKKPGPLSTDDPSPTHAHEQTHAGDVATTLPAASPTSPHASGFFNRMMGKFRGSQMSSDLSSSPIHVGGELQYPASPKHVAEHGLPSHRIIVCGPIDFMRSVLGVLVQLDMDTNHVDCL